jgi:hypothetical protein
MSDNNAQIIERNAQQIRELRARIGECERALDAAMDYFYGAEYPPIADRATFADLYAVLYKARYGVEPRPE